MENAFDQVRAAVAEATTTLRAADSVARDLASLLVGRLHHVHSPAHLAALKKELRHYNIHTGRWAKKK